MKAYLFLLSLISIFFLGSCKKTSTSERPVSPVPVDTIHSLISVITMPVIRIENNTAISGFTITNTLLKPQLNKKADLYQPGTGIIGS